MRIPILIVLSFSLALLQSCKSLSESAKYGLNSGYYQLKTGNKEDVPVYVYAEEDTLAALRLDNRKEKEVSEKSRRQPILFPEISRKDTPPRHIFKEYSFDFDVLAIPFKYRPSEKDMERQLTTQFNGALYIGYRTDRYRVRYEQTPLGFANRSITHLGYSIGIFSGIGAESINPWVTQDQYPGEYEGLAWSKGIGGIIGINNFNVGLGLGFDSLLDSNRKIWIYQQQPWVGILLGLNLN